MIWKIPEMWKGGECWIIGGGPSVPRMFGVPESVIESVQNKVATLGAYSPYLSALHDKHVIGVNTAYLYGDWVDVVVFGDSQFYLEHAKRLLNFKGIKVSSHPRVHSRHPGIYHIKFTPLDTSHPVGLTDKRGHVSWNKHSGSGAINLAYHFGAKRIYLLGFDMKLDVNGKSHSHAEYFREGLPKFGKNLPYDRHLAAYPKIAADAERLGLEIINVNDDSAITQFPIVTNIKEVL